MRIDQMRDMANVEEEDDFSEVQTHALINIAASLELILSVIQDDDFLRRKTMSDTYKCECGHTVHSDSKEPPESLNWSDGHICLLIKQEKEENNE